MIPVGERNYRTCLSGACEEMVIKGIKCGSCEGWFHLKCCGLQNEQHNPLALNEWFCPEWKNPRKAYQAKIVADAETNLANPNPPQRSAILARDKWPQSMPHAVAPKRPSAKIEARKPRAQKQGITCSCWSSTHRPSASLEAKDSGQNETSWKIVSKREGIVLKIFTSSWISQFEHLGI